ncbi:MAG: hypothetical protein M1598_03915, partial [Actinobacteria bacterium]|nr:hypothetical protein [Actinomycetota bacterium]
IAAVYYVLGQEFDRDPFLIFQLRGRTREEIVQALRERRAAAADAFRMEQAREAGIPAGDNTQAANALAGDDANLDDSLERSLERFWSSRDERLGSLEFSMTRPPVDAGYLRRFGKPRFWPAGQDPGPGGPGGSGRDFFDVMGQCYRAVAVRALEAAFENSPASTEEPS